jgi:hypothetical protein
MKPQPPQNPNATFHLTIGADCSGLPPINVEQHSQRPQQPTLCEMFEAIVADARAEAEAVVAACNARSKATGS